MSAEYTPTDSWWDSFLEPKDGETWNFATVFTAVVNKLADNAKHLKLNKAGLTDENTFTGSQSFDNVIANTAGIGQATVTRLFLAIANDAGIRYNRSTLADADTTVGPNHQSYRIPEITADRLYTLTVGQFSGQRVRFSRPRSADAFAVTIVEDGAGSLAVMNSSDNAWIEFEWNGTHWTTSAWGGAVATFTQTV